MAEKRFHRSKRWDRKFAEAPLEVKQTISNALAMLAEGHTKPGPIEGSDPLVQPRDVDLAPILRVTEASCLGPER